MSSWNAYRNRILKFKTQFEPGSIRLENLSPAIRKKQFDGLVIVGMGGSGLPGTLLESLAEAIKLPVPFVVSKTYGLPKMPFKKPLVLCVSFSGNTEETLSAFREAKRGKLPLAVVTSGGKLLPLARAARVPLASFDPQDLTPREAIGYTWTSVKFLLANHFASVVRVGFSGVLHPAKLEEEGKTLATHFKSNIPLIYTDSAYASVGYVWKINLNETGKSPAFANVIPEMVHNEIAGFETAGRVFVPCFILDPRASKEIRKKTRVVKKVLETRGFRTVTTTLRGKTKEEKIMNAIVLSEWTSLYVAKMNKKDPKNTRIIEEIKK
ncbi:MAG: SIS domain-containing protein [Patescibacteria group bacterium]